MTGFRTDVTITIESDRPLPAGRVELWMRRARVESISVHEVAQEPGDPRADEDGWVYVSLGRVVVSPSRAV